MTVLQMMRMSWRHSLRRVLDLLQQDGGILGPELPVDVAVGAVAVVPVDHVVAGSGTLSDPGS